LYDDADLALSEIMQSYWTNFAKTGDPNGDGLPEWPLWDPEEDLLLELNDEIRLIPNPYQDLNGLLDRYQEETLTADPEEQDKTE
jgi:para-nitrobenzyl esterase